MEGNQMKMREAAVTAYDALEKLKQFSLQLGDVGHMRKFNHLVCLAKNRLDAALSAPPRQCDVGTAEEQIDRHREWCNRDNDSSYCCNDCRDCFARWAQMPCEAEEGDAK
jgi:hypothetical protein